MQVVTARRKDPVHLYYKPIKTLLIISFLDYMVVYNKKTKIVIPF